MVSGPTPPALPAWVMRGCNERFPAHDGRCAHGVLGLTMRVETRLRRRNGARRSPQTRLHSLDREWPAGKGPSAPRCTSDGLVLRPPRTHTHSYERHLVPMDPACLDCTGHNEDLASAVYATLASEGRRQQSRSLLPAGKIPL